MQEYNTYNYVYISSLLSESLQVSLYRFLHFSQHGLHFISSQCVFLLDVM